MDILERVAMAIWGDVSYRPIGWETATRAALAAMLEAVGEPVAWRYDYLDQFSGVRTELSLTRWSTRHRQGWTETPLYSLAALREALPPPPQD